MAVEPDYQTAPKPSKLSYAVETLWPKASRLLFAQRLRTTNVRTPAVLVSEPALGGAWVPVTPRQSTSPIETMKAWCVFINSSCGAILFLNCRSQDLSYSKYSLDLLRSIPLPDPSLADLAPLVRAFNNLCEAELLPWAQMDKDPVRHKIDDAVAEVLDLDPAEMADWRRRIVNEPTVSNKPAQ